MESGEAFMPMSSKQDQVSLPAAFDVWLARATALAPGDRFDRATTQIAELSTALGLAA
jgi:hypothetical protein